MGNFVLTPNAVAKLRRAIAPRSGNTGAVAATGVPLDPDKFPPPFTVRWSASENNGAGAWVIWLPGLGNLVALGGAFVSTVGGISAAQGLPGGWYTIDDLTANSTAAYLVVTVIDSTGAASAELSGTPGQATTGETVYNVKVADIATGAAGAKSVKQYVDSIVTIGGSGGGASVTPDDISTEFIPDPPSGTQPDGDEGELQIKGFKSGQPATNNTIAEYLMGTAQITGQVWLIVRGKSTGGDPVLGYLPLDVLNLYDYAKKTDLPSAPGDGTLTIKQGTTTLGTFTANQATGTTVTIPEPPTPPTVNDGTLTIKQGTTTLGTFTANQATGTTVTIPEPPTPPTVNDGTLTLTLGSQTKTFSANQQNDVALTVPAKRLISGTNISITVNGNDITISSSGGGGSTSGFTGTRRTLALTRYDIETNYLQAKFFTETWSNGLMTVSDIDDEWSNIEGGQAVMENV